MSFQLAYLDLNVARSKGQGQGHAHYDCQYLQIGDRLDKHSSGGNEIYRSVTECLRALPRS